MYDFSKLRRMSPTPIYSNFKARRIKSKSAKFYLDSTESSITSKLKSSKSSIKLSSSKQVKKKERLSWYKHSADRL